MRVNLDGPVQSCCHECGRDTRNSIQFKSYLLALCWLCMRKLQNLIDEAGD